MNNKQNKGNPVFRNDHIRHMFIPLLGISLCFISLATWADQDVVVLLSNSSSMRAQAKVVARAITEFANSRGPDTRMAFITYAKDAALRVPMSAISDVSRRQISDALSRLDYRGQATDTAAGMAQALTEIIDQMHGDSQKSIVLITNDIAKLGDAAANKQKLSWIMQSQIPTAVYNHVRIYAVTFTSDADYKTLQVLAQSTGGIAFRVSKDTDLSGIFQQIGANLQNAGPGPILISSGHLSPPALAVPLLSSQFKTPLTRKNDQSTGSHWLWLIGLLTLLVALAGIYGAWNIMRHIRLPKETIKPLTYFGEGPRAVLYDISNPNDIKRFELAERSTLLGRVAGYDPEVQYVLVKEKTVGRCHAVIERRGHSFWIMDQGSINGTFVNGERITSDRALKHGDIIAIHRHEFEFMIPEYFESESTVVGAREQLAG